MFSKNEKIVLSAIVLFALTTIAFELAVGNMTFARLPFVAVFSAVVSWCWFQIEDMPEDKTDI